jgi:hypothetical protein
MDRTEIPMAKIISEVITITISKMMKDDTKDHSILMNVTDIDTIIEQIVTETLGDPTLVVEVSYPPKLTDD